MAENHQFLVESGLEAAVSGMRPKKNKRERTTPLPRKPSRGSRRLAGEVAELNDTLEGEAFLDEDVPTQVDTLKRASNAPRLTAEQAATLDAQEEVSAGPLTEEELEAIGHAREYLRTDSTEGGWKAHSAKGTSLYEEKRALLAEAADMFGLRWPTWLGKIEAAKGITWGSTATARHQTMFAIERAACGMGLDYKGWPDGVGVLLATDEAEASTALPRVLRLGSDTEMLRREGQRLEAHFGRDAGNGWAYNHALGKLRRYQEILLGSDEPSARSVRELEEAE